MLKNKSFSYSQTSIQRSCTLNLYPIFPQSINQINLRPGKKKAELSALQWCGAQQAIKFNEMTVFRKLTILKVTDMGLLCVPEREKNGKCFTYWRNGDPEEMRKHLGMNNPLPQGLKNGDSWISAFHQLVVCCKEQSNWEQNTTRQLWSALSPYLT